jgi:hypothetical protein
LGAAARLRTLTVRLPHRPLRWLSAPVALSLYLALVLPGRVGARLRVPALARLPLSVYRGQPVRSLWLDTFDRLSAPIERRYSREELDAWVAAAGLAPRAAWEDAGHFILLEKPDDTITRP